MMATLGEWLTRCRESRKLILIIVAIALLLDNMLLTTVVPIIPNYLYKLSHPNETDEDIARNLRMTDPPPTPVMPPKTTPRCRDPEPPDIQPTIKIDTCALVKEKEAFITEDDKNICFSVSEEEVKDISRQLGSQALRTNQKQQINATVESKKSRMVKDMATENVRVGMMFSSKAFVQLLTNPFIGPLTHRIGYSIPMFAGFVIMFLSTLIFAFGSSYGVLFLARALQGVGSSCSSVSGMGMLAERYPDDKERGNAMGLALGGLALGVLIGPPFGGILSQYVGKMVPFLLLAVLALGDGLLQLLVLQPAVVKKEEEAPTLAELVKDPYIIIAAGAITFANMGMGMLEPTLPIWMMSTMSASESEEGLAFLPASISYLIGTNLFGPLGHLMGRWLASLLGLFVIGLCMCTIPEATSMAQLIAPMAGLGFAIGMVDSSMMPELGFLVDLRHTAVYGSVYSIGDVAFCLGFAIGPALAGSLVETVGFHWMLYGIGFINFLYAPLMYFLKNPPSKSDEKQSLFSKKTEASFRYINFTDDEDREENYEEQNSRMVH